MISWWSEDAEFIRPFDINHFIYIAIVVMLLVVLFTKRRKIKEHSTAISVTILVIAILQQILLYSWYALETGFNIAESLPLHISRITSLLCIYFLITKNLKVMDIIFYFSLFAYASFLYPQRIYPFYHVIGISYLVSHAVTILIPYFAYIAYGWRPSWKGVIRTYLIFVVYFFFVYFLNPLIDGNYFYLKYRPFLNDWSDFLYNTGTLIVVLLAFIIVHFVVKKIGKNRVK